MKRNPLRPASLAQRLTVTIGIVATLVFLVFGWIINRSIEQHFAQQDAGELAMLSQSVQQVLAATPPDKREMLRQRLGDVLAGHEGMVLHLSRSDGTMIFSSSALDFSTVMASVPPRNQFDENSLQVWKIGQKSYRGAILNLSFGAAMQYTMVIATAIDFHLHYLAGIHHKLWLLIMLGIVTMLALVWLAVYQGHAPLRRITNEIRQIGADRLHVRLATESVPAELAPLATSFNTMLERIEEMVHRLSNFSADIAHELRTPVASLMTQTQVSLANMRSVDEYREVLYSSLEEYERMAQMIGDMLFLAQHDRNLISANVSVLDMAREVHSLFAYFEALADERGITLQLDGMASVYGDRHMLRRALSNLLSNAIRYTPAGGVIAVTLNAGADARTVELTVKNPGPTIAPEQLEKIFDRFYRIEKSRSHHGGGEGAGLGLAIVKSIVEAHQGQVCVHCAGGSTIFHVLLPAAG